MSNLIPSITHPHYDLHVKEWWKWRLAYVGGWPFIHFYLQRFSIRETLDEFEERKKVTYCPSFAKAAIDEVKNSLYQRFADIERIGGSDSYQDACDGNNGGVDLFGNSMSHFMGVKVLPELLIMQKVGIYIDMPRQEEINLLTGKQPRPYLYVYPAEDIRSWISADSDEYTGLILEDKSFETDPKTGFPMGEKTTYRKLWKEDNTVFAQIYDSKGNYLDLEPTVIGTGEIPFVVVELPNSLMSDIADYQIALLNLVSSDMAYILKANFPFYVEQQDQRGESSHLRSESEGIESAAQMGRDKEIKVGVTAGRAYPYGATAPAFIHPSSEPLKASMEKQEQIKADIKRLLNLSIASMRPSLTSADSKREDLKSLESGLSYIGLQLETAERKIAQIWSKYENNKIKHATINYPITYSLRSEEDRRHEAQQLSDIQDRVTSKTFQKEIAKQIARTMLSNKVSRETLDTIDQEIEKANGVNCSVKDLVPLVTSGIIDPATAAVGLGYPEEVVEKAQEYQAKRLKIINDAQSTSAARGVPDGDPNAGQSSQEEKAASRDQTKKANPSKGTRGKGKFK